MSAHSLEASPPAPAHFQPANLLQTIYFHNIAQAQCPVLRLPAPVTVIVLPVRAAFKVKITIRQQRALHRRLHARLAD